MARKYKTTSEPQSPPLTIAEQRQRLVEAGDVMALFSIWTRSTLSEINFQEVADMLRQAVEVRVRKDPTRFAQELFSEMVGVVGFLLLRSHFRVRKLVEREDAQMNLRGRWDSSRDLEELVKQTVLLQKHLAELAHLDASTRRLIELTRQRRLANEAARLDLPRRAPSRRRASRSRPSPAEPATSPVNRIGEFLDG